MQRPIHALHDMIMIMGSPYFCCALLLNILTYLILRVVLVIIMEFHWLIGRVL